MTLLPAWAMSRARQLSQFHLPALVSQRMSGATALNILRNKGIGYRKGDFYRDWNYWQEQQATWKGMRRVPNIYTAGERYYPEVAYTRPYKYSTVFEISYKDELTGKRMHKYSTVYHTHMEAGREVSDEVLEKTMGELKEAAIKVLGEYVSLEDIEIEEVVAHHGYQSNI